MPKIDAVDIDVVDLRNKDILGAERAEAKVARVEALATGWRNGRTTSGVDRMVPATDIRAALADQPDQETDHA